MPPALPHPRATARVVAFYSHLPALPPPLPATPSQYARAVNAEPLDSSSWRMWAEFEEAAGDDERAEVLAKHAQFTETQALLQESLGSSKAKSGNPLAPSNLYR